MKRMTTSLVLTFLICLLPILPALTMANLKSDNALARTTQSAATGGGAQASQPAEDRGWPRGYTTPSGAQIVLYQPQVLSWENQAHMIALAAASYLSKDKQKPELGALRVDAITQVSTEQRLVRFSVLKITEANFPSLAKEQTQELVAEIVKTIPEEDRVIALDRVLAQVDKSQIIPKNVDSIRGDPPLILSVVPLRYC